MIIDIHAHILVSEILADHGNEVWRLDTVQQPNGGLMVRNKLFTNGPTIKPLIGPGKIVEAMQAVGVDLAVLSTPPYAFYYDLPPRDGEYASAIQNDGLARAVAEYPQHLAGLGTVPLQDITSAVKELNRLMTDLRLSGIEIASNVNGEDLGHDRYRPFWEAVEGLGAVVFVHPAYFEQIGMKRMTDFYLRNLLGNPMETAQFGAHLIFSGILEAYPRLKIVLAHGGGVLPYLLGRMDHGYHVRPEPKRRIPRPPSEYLSMFYFDIITHHRLALRYLVNLVGADQVLLGSDYPYDMGYNDPVQVVNQLPDLSQVEREKILGGNALRLLGRA